MDELQVKWSNILTAMHTAAATLTGFRLIMMQKRVKVKSSTHPVGRNLRQNWAFFFFYLETEDDQNTADSGFFFFFYSLVFVFQRLPCPPVHPAWNVAQKVDVVWSYQRAPEWSCPRKELETLPTSSKTLGSKTSIVLSRLIHLGALWVRRVTCYIIIKFTYYLIVRQ